MRKSLKVIELCYAYDLANFEHSIIRTCKKLHATCLHVRERYKVAK